jgi:hypothetical protein
MIAERDFFRLKPTTAGKLIVRRVHNQRPALPLSRQTFYEHVPLFQPKGFDHGVSSVADQFASGISNSLLTCHFRWRPNHRAAKSLHSPGTPLS